MADAQYDDTGSYRERVARLRTRITDNDLDDEWMPVFVGDMRILLEMVEAAFEAAALDFGDSNWALGDFRRKLGMAPYG